MIRSYLLILCFLLGVADTAKSEVLETIRIEGHGFSASTLKPLPGVRVELHAFPEFGQPSASASLVSTDEGGFYTYEFLALKDENGSNPQIGYAFALICKHGGNQMVQIMPLYSSLLPQTVYTRNFYMQVPSTVTRCDGL